MEVADGAEQRPVPLSDMTYIDGTVYRTRALDRRACTIPDPAGLRSAPEKPQSHMPQAFVLQYRNTDPFTAKRLAEPYCGRSLWCKIRRRSL